MTVSLTFLGATETVTGSKYLLEYNSKRILIDCGLFQGHKELRLRNWSKLPVDVHSIDAVIITHAHIDHSGYIPLLVKNGFKGRIYCSDATAALCELLLVDSGYLQEEDAHRANRHGYSKHTPAQPLYTRRDAELALPFLYAQDFGKTFSPIEGLSVTLHRAGHILGAAWISIECDGKRIIFSGDIGRLSDPLMCAPEPLGAVDYMVLESTYGNRLHGESDPIQLLADSIVRTVAQGGSVIIPAFAVGRTQTILYYLYQLKQAGRIPEVPIYLDSPMAINVTRMMQHYGKEHGLSESECAAVCAVAEYVSDVEFSKALDQKPCPKIIISASGMATGGRILHHLKHYLPDAKHAIVFAGYQASGTRGDRLLNGEKEIKIHGEMVPVNATIDVIHTMSAHADYSEILTWLETVTQMPKKLFVTHGSLDASEALQGHIIARYGWDVTVPHYQHVEVL